MGEMRKYFLLNLPHPPHLNKDQLLMTVPLHKGLLVVIGVQSIKCPS
jgi:hypothetical protein